MTDDTARICIEIFRDMMGLDTAGEAPPPSDDEMLVRPIESFDIDSLDTMEFVMAIEDRFDLLLNEAAVNECRTLDDFVTLVAGARGV